MLLPLLLWCHTVLSRFCSRETCLFWHASRFAHDECLPAKLHGSNVAGDKRSFLPGEEGRLEAILWDPKYLEKLVKETGLLKVLGRVNGQLALAAWWSVAKTQHCLSLSHSITDKFLITSFRTPASVAFKNKQTKKSHQRPQSMFQNWNLNWMVVVLPQRQSLLLGLLCWKPDHVWVTALASTRIIMHLLGCVPLLA